MSRMAGAGPLRQSGSVFPERVDFLATADAARGGRPSTAAAGAISDQHAGPPLCYQQLHVSVQAEAQPTSNAQRAAFDLLNLGSARFRNTFADMNFGRDYGPGLATRSMGSRSCCELSAAIGGWAFQGTMPSRSPNRQQVFAAGCLGRARWMLRLRHWRSTRIDSTSEWRAAAGRFQRRTESRTSFSWLPDSTVAGSAAQTGGSISSGCGSKISVINCYSGGGRCMAHPRQSDHSRLAIRIGMSGMARSGGSCRHAGADRRCGAEASRPSPGSER